MGLLYALFAKKIRLLKVDVQFSDKGYSVSFNKLHPDATDIEFVYLFIYHFAEILFKLPYSFPEKTDFFDALRFVNLSNCTSEYLKEIDSNLAHRYMKYSHGNKPFSSTLTYHNTYTRGMISTLPKNIPALDSLRTILIIGAESFNHIGSLESNILRNAICYQISLYQNGVNPKKFDAVSQLPFDVFQYAVNNRNILDD